MVPRPLAPSRALRSRTCVDVIQPCQPRVKQEPRSAHGHAVNKPRVDYEPRSDYNRAVKKKTKNEINHW